MRSLFQPESTECINQLFANARKKNLKSKGIWHSGVDSLDDDTSHVLTVIFPDHMADKAIKILSKQDHVKITQEINYDFYKS